MLSKIEAWIAKIGVQPWWIALNAHCWFAFSVTIVFGHYRWFLPLAISLAAFKEYYLDARNEVPKQTFADNTEDFAGYMLGILLAFGYMTWLFHSHHQIVKVS